MVSSTEDGLSLHFLGERIGGEAPADRKRPYMSALVHQSAHAVLATKGCRRFVMMTGCVKESDSVGEDGLQPFVSCVRPAYDGRGASCMPTSARTVTPRAASIHPSPADRDQGGGRRRRKRMRGKSPDDWSRGPARRPRRRGQCIVKCSLHLGMTNLMLRRQKEIVDVEELLRSRRLHVEELVEGYFATESYARRGGYLELVVKELSGLIATRSEVLRPALRKLDGGQQHLERLDEARGHQLTLLRELDERSIGVGPRDVHQHEPRRLIALMGELSGQIHHYDAYEARELVPFLQAALTEKQWRHLGRKAAKVSRRGPTHAHPNRPPADERTRWGKAVSALYDRLQDVGQQPEATIESRGEQGP